MTWIDALLALLEPKPVNGSRARQIHYPPEDCPVGGIVATRSPPDFEKHVERQLLGAFAVAADALGQREHEPVRPLVEPMQRHLVAGRDGSHEVDPFTLRSK